MRRSGFTPMPEPAPVRSFAAAVWRAPNNPAVHAMVDIDYTAAAAFLARYNERHGVKVTPTHLVGRAMALLLDAFPEGNATVDWRGFWLRESADVSFVVSTEGGRNLAQARIEAADRLSLAEIERRLRDRAAAIRNGDDGQNAAFARRMRGKPLWLTRLIIGATLFATRRLGLDLTRHGVPRDPWGGAVITAVGTLGYETAFTTTIPHSDCAMYVAVMAVREMPWVVDGAVVPRPVLRLCCTADHRMVDGHLGGQYLAGLKAYLSQPERLLTDEEAAAWEAPGA